jgi:hypothetical protein
VGGLFQSLLYSAYERVRVEFGPDNLVQTAALYTYTVVAYERDMLPSGSLLIVSHKSWAWQPKLLNRISARLFSSGARPGGLKINP